MNVPFVNLAAQYLSLEEEILAAIQDVGRSGGYILGEKLESFEKDLASYLGVKHAIGVANGSDALFLTLKVLGIGPGDEVITAPNSFIATGWVIAATGATPVFADVAEDMNLDPRKAEQAVTRATKAIIPVHLTGRPAPMMELNALAEEKNLLVVEDAAQAIGASYRGKKVGSLGRAAGFSLHPLKNLGVMGDGGIIATDDSNLADTLRKFRNHGLKSRDECEFWGFNSRLDPIHAVVASIKLKHLDRWNERTNEIANRYRNGLQSLVQVPEDKPYEYCVYHNFVIRTEARNGLMAFLEKEGVQNRVHYPIPIHLQQAAAYLGYKSGDFPNAEQYANTMISLPIYPELTDEQVDFVIKKIGEYLK
ncbi:MAG: DegT/DnrJ/EryC1/StrS family aminotransferase [Leptospiraceae bacterium]|nr:DegT/DnrJ/EryC1/StrS family aminotransferase [Leptospiraceae bacterium]